MGLEITQSAPTRLHFVMIDDTDFKTPETGFTFSDLTCKLARNGETVLVAKTLTAENTRHLGEGVYEIDFTASELSFLGGLVSVVTAAGALPYYREDQVVAPALSGVTIQTQLADTTPIPSVKIQIRDAGGSTVLAQGATDTGGELVVGLPPGTYKVYCWKAGYTFAGAPFTLVITGDDTVTYNGAPFAPSDPGGPDLTTVFGYLIDSGGAARVGVSITFKPILVDADGRPIERIRPLVDTDTDKLLSRPDRTVTTDGDGYFEIQLVPNPQIEPGDTKYYVTISDSPIDYSLITVPETGPVNIETLLPA